MCKTFKQLPKFTPSGKHFSTFIVSPNSRRVSSPFKKLALSNSFLKLNHFSSLPSNSSSNSSFSSFLSSPLSFAKGKQLFQFFKSFMFFTLNEKDGNIFQDQKIQKKRKTRKRKKKEIQKELKKKKKKHPNFRIQKVIFKTFSKSKEQRK